MVCSPDWLTSDTAANVVSDKMSDQNTVFVSGEFNVRNLATETAISVDEKAYVLKLSYFNQLNKGRQDEEDKIDRLAAEKLNGWTREARLYLSKAIGVPQPNALGILRFESSDGRLSFRRQHSDVVDEIKRFNMKYIKQATYFYVDNVSSIP